MQKNETILQLNDAWRVRHSLTPKQRWWLERRGKSNWHMLGVFVSREAVGSHVRRMFKDHPDPDILSAAAQLR
ncbi:hypothetical protein HFO63_34100 [Rhizobium laguerreae]|uniref:hypothetical protein n=1 Tax=Rhizobium laguerreae TaxID=1076926 RepID=UPI001C918CF8|nr:hypothetical protein [Rhizobium laguerreae]MBY3150525.1 hypothetical protein [Rhizobium laguerreae]MBY3169805.1 hypothetical protein [Rhizobium laguerreae]MBY3193040.1 hypothetical protein [Rhizobium laguerreae]